MASIQKTGKRWRAQVSKGGVRRSQVFASRQEARDWAARVEADLAAHVGRRSRQPLAEVLDRYARTVSPTKKGHRWEVIRLERWKSMPMAARPISDITAPDIAAWRDARLLDVSPGTVRREWNLLSAVFTVAAREWHLITASPMTGVRQPSAPPKRDRLPMPDEIERLRFVAGDDLGKQRARAVQAFLFAIETGMRAGEICGLRWCDLDLPARVATLPRTKNGDKRQVPLSAEAVRLIEALPEADPVFGLTARGLDAAWRMVRDRAGIKGLTFHDSRHFAVTRLARKLDPLALARMIGHRDLKMLMVYYDEAAEDVARRLD